MRGLAVIGNLSRDVIDGGQPRVGGAPYHAARALRLLGGRSRIVARGAEADRRVLLPPLVALGVPVAWLAAARTTSFELRYSGEERTIRLTDAGEPWTIEDAHTIGRAAWVQVGGLTREDFPPDVLAVLARYRRLALDGQALVRPGVTGELVPDAEFDRDVLRYVSVLKLSEREAETIGGLDAVAELGVPEVLLTLGSRGALLLAGDRSESIPVRRIEGRNPTGAGDAFLAGYVWAREAGHRPASAARHAASIAARVVEVGF